MPVTKIPDGQGGWREVDIDEVHPGRKADKDKQAEALQEAFYEDGGRLTEKLMAFDRAYINEYGLTKEHRVFAAALYCVNLREGYPDGKDAFDTIAQSAADYYDREITAMNAKKRKA